MHESPFLSPRIEWQAAAIAALQLAATGVAVLNRSNAVTTRTIIMSAPPTITRIVARGEYPVLTSEVEEESLQLFVDWSYE